METDQIAQLRSLMSEEYEQAKNYSNIIMGVGYAGFFGLWAVTKDFGNPKAHSLAALFIGISLILFVFWEIFQTAKKGNMFVRLSNAMSAGTLNAVVYQQEHVALARTLSRRWIYVFYPCVFFGVAGSGTLLGVLMLKAVRDLLC